MCEGCGIPDPRSAGVPLVYELDEHVRPVPQEGAIAPLTGRYLGDPEAIRERVKLVIDQTKRA